MDRLEPFDDGRALLAGFLIGDTGHLSEIDIDAMRRSGLSHFTAVSGSNVALFLGLLFGVSGPLALGPRRRAVIGILGLPIYAAATGFEPSVMRASLMAGLVLAGRLIGVTLDVWQVLALAVTVLVIVDPSMISSVGFQLSVVATAGVLVGARWPVRGGRVARALAVTGWAQIAVAPLLVLHFGQVPLISPAANLAAAPLVTAATLTGALGTAGVPGLVGVAAPIAMAVLEIARALSGWPQLGVGGLSILSTAGFLFWMRPGWRGPLAVAGAIGMVVMAIGPGRQLPVPAVVVLDVGQGDALLISGGGGRFALVDGGPDPSVLIQKLHDYGVRHLDLVVLTHVHADHATGLAELPGRVSIGEVWMNIEPHRTAASDRLTLQLDTHGVTVAVPEVGESQQLGSLRLAVIGPTRRFASPNDQSLVVMVEGPGRSMLLSGDIEEVAQRELSDLHAEVLKVPHQGAATSDEAWLRDFGADLAVISVGPNDFGHPADWVVEVLVESGAVVMRTDRKSVV